MPHGMYRDGDFAQISDQGKISIPISRSQYEAKGYQPPFDDLLTKEAFEIHARGVKFGDDA